MADVCSDDACSVNGGEGVSIRNTGCLEEAGRGSVYMPNNGLLKDPYCLILTVGEGCNCQSDSYQLYAIGECAPLPNPAYQSYRFVHVSAAHNIQHSTSTPRRMQGLKADGRPGHVWREHLLMMGRAVAGPDLTLTVYLMTHVLVLYLSVRANGSEEVQDTLANSGQSPWSTHSQLSQTCTQREASSGLSLVLLDPRVGNTYIVQSTLSAN
jgi:hypothetical protein